MDASRCVHPFALIPPLTRAPAAVPSLPAPCIICGDRVHFVPSGTRALCRRPACQWAFNSTPAHARCRLCERPLTRAQLAGKVCDDDDCQRRIADERRVAQARLWREARERFEQRAGSVRSAAAPLLGVSDPDGYELGRVPYLPNRTTPLPGRRRAAYVAHLVETVAEAFAARAAGVELSEFDPQHDQRYNVAPPTEAIGVVLGRGCAQCRGACCPQGDTRAFLDVPTIARYLAQHPDATEAEVVDAYVAYLGSRTIAGGCVNQGARGCTLPREMRSAICNNFLCGGLRELVGQLVARSADVQEDPRVFYQAGVDDDVRYAFVDVRDVRVVRVVRRAVTGIAANALDTTTQGS